jgi:hypothetical protein
MRGAVRMGAYRADVSAVKSAELATHVERHIEIVVRNLFRAIKASGGPGLGRRAAPLDRDAHPIFGAGCVEKDVAAAATAAEVGLSQDAAGRRGSW